MSMPGGGVEKVLNADQGFEVPEGAPRLVGAFIYRFNKDGSVQFLLNAKDDGHRRWPNKTMTFGGAINFVEKENEELDLVFKEDGTLDADATSMHAILRELKEEILIDGNGLELFPEELRIVQGEDGNPFQAFSPRNPKPHLMRGYFADLTTILPEETDAKLTTTEGAAVWLTPEEILKLKQEGKIPDHIYELYMAFVLMNAPLSLQAQTIDTLDISKEDGSK